MTSTDTHVTWSCSQGKSRVKGLPAPPFRWLVPSAPWPGEEKQDAPSRANARFLHYRAQVHPENPPLVVPALFPLSCALRTATGFAQVAMPANKFNKLLPTLLQLDIGFPERSGPLPSSKCLRRTSQGICEASAMQMHGRLAFGNWVDDYMDKASKRFSSTCNMPHVYTDACVKERSQLDAKAMVWTAITEAFAELGSTLPSAQWHTHLPGPLRRACVRMRAHGEPKFSKEASGVVLPSLDTLETETKEKAKSEDKKKPQSRCLIVMRRHPHPQCRGPVPHRQTVLTIWTGLSGACRWAQRQNSTASRRAAFRVAQTLQISPRTGGGVASL